MIRFIGILFSLILPFSVNAQSVTVDACPEFAAATGTRIKFSADEKYRPYGFQMFHRTPEITAPIDFDSLAGKQAKVTGGQPGQYNIAYFHHVLVEDCKKIFWYDTDSRLEQSDTIAGDIIFVDQPPTTWKVVEATDPMTDAKSCRITPDSDMPLPLFFYHSAQGFSVGIVGGDFPGKPTMFRVDKNQAISEIEGLSGGHAQALATQIRAGGSRLLISAYKWPYENIVRNEFNLAGLAEKLDYCKAWIRK